MWRALAIAVLTLPPTAYLAGVVTGPASEPAVTAPPQDAAPRDPSPVRLPAGTPVAAVGTTAAAPVEPRPRPTRASRPGPSPRSTPDRAPLPSPAQTSQGGTTDTPAPTAGVADDAGVGAEPSPTASTSPTADTGAGTDDPTEGPDFVDTQSPNPGARPYASP